MENTEKATPFEFDDGLYGRDTKPVPKEEKNIGIDTQDVLFDNIVGLAENNILDITAIENFTNTARNRNSIYNIIDTMGDDSVISSVLEAYTEDATEYNDEGRIVWVESDDDKIGQYIDFLLRSLQVDKHIFKWAYCLIKYGDVYLRLYRKSEYDNIKFENKKAKLEEGVVVKAFSKNDKFAHYVDMVANPANVFELTKYGKTYGYIVTSNSEAVQKNDGFFNTMYSFTMKQTNVDLYDAQEFVHGCMEDNISRVQEVVNLEMNSEDGVESDGGTTFKYDVRKGQSLLYNTFKVWRQLKLLEDSVLLNRITKSSILRVIEVQVGDMAKESVANHLMNIKQKIEQKTAIDSNVSMNEYNNPGPIENNIYVPVRGEKGSINTKQIGGDVDVKSLADLDYFTDSLFGSLRVPKEFFGHSNDAVGFNGGTALSIRSSRYAKTIKRIQNVLIQMITDVINIMLLDSGLNSYVGKFQIKMLPPTTQEELDRRSNLKDKVSYISDIMNLLSDIDSADTKLEIVKSLLSGVISDPDVISLIQEEIEKMEEEGATVDDTEDEEQRGDIGDINIGINDRRDTGEPSFGEPTEEPEQSAEPEEGSAREVILPSPEDLGVDMVDNNNQEL